MCKAATKARTQTAEHMISKELPVYTKDEASSVAAKYALKAAKAKVTPLCSGALEGLCGLKSGSGTLCTACAKHHYHTVSVHAGCTIQEIHQFCFAPSDSKNDAT